VEIETHSDLTLGMTVVGRLNVAEDERNQALWSPVLQGKHKARVCWAIDIRRWKHALFEALQ